MSSKLRYSPCIGLCSTVYGDDICRGCKRSSDEVIIWNQMDEPIKIEALSRIDQLVTEEMFRFFEIQDEDLLHQQIDHFDIWLHPNQPLLSKAFTLFLKCRDHLKNVESCGLKLKTPATLSLNQLIDQIDEAIYAKALEHFEATS